MFRVLLLVLFLIVVGVMALAAVAYSLWGFPGFAGVIVGVIASLWLLKRLIGYALQRLFLAPFKAKGAVLSGAQATVHAVTPAEQPARRYDPSADDAQAAAALHRGDGTDDEDEGEPLVPLRWFRIDVTITPTAKTTAFQMWEPGELLLARPGSDPQDEEEEAGATIEEVRVWQDGAFRDDDGMKYAGSQRLELLAGIPEGVERLCFRYYFEDFGEVRVPGS